MVSTLLDPPAEPRLSRHHAMDDQPNVLWRIDEPLLNLSIWIRDRIPAAESAVRALLAAPYAVAIDEKAPDENRLFGSLQQIIGSHAPMVSIRALAGDMVHLSKLFSEIAKTIHPRVRLERVEDDGCALFHADSLRLRLLCTYAGPGTQWLENFNVRREQLV